jgi:hypothetical protein
MVAASLQSLLKGPVVHFYINRDASSQGFVALKVYNYLSLLFLISYESRVKASSALTMIQHTFRNDGRHPHTAGSLRRASSHFRSSTAQKVVEKIRKQKQAQGYPLDGVNNTENGPLGLLQEAKCASEFLRAQFFHYSPTALRPGRSGRAGSDWTL